MSDRNKNFMIIQSCFRKKKNTQGFYELAGYPDTLSSTIFKLEIERYLFI